MKFEITSLAAIAALSTAVTAGPCSGHGGAGGFGGFGGGSAAPSGVAAPSGGFGGYAGPTGGASVAFPTGTATAPTTTSPAAVAAADEGDDEEQDEDSSSSSSDAAEATPSDSGDEASATASDSAPATTAAPATNGTGSTGASSGSGGSSVLDAPQTIAAGETFDGAGATFDRGVSCTGQAEGGDSDAVFILENGATLSNVVIGANQIEGVHCFGACKLENVVWDAVCEDAFTIKEQADGETTTITGGGATGAEDKVLQHNGGGSLAVSGFTVNTFGKLYRSCGNCDEMPTRSVTITDVTATDGDILCGINSNYGDTCTVSGGSQSGVKDICCEFEGNDTGDEPTKIGCGASAACNIGDAAGAAKRSIGSKFNKWM